MVDREGEGEEKTVGEMCDLERWIFNTASLWLDLHENVFHEQSFLEMACHI